MQKRELAAAVVSRSGAADLAALVQRRGVGRTLRVLAYHRVLPTLSTVWDEGVVDATAGAFRSQMAFLKRHYTALSFATLAEYQDRGESLPPNAVIVTFDDGYRDNYEVAFPILAEMGLPATIFLATGYVGGDRPFWWDRVAFSVKHARRDRVTLPTGETVSSSTPAECLAAVKVVLRSLKRVTDEEKDRYINELETDLGARCEKGQADDLLLTWEQVREMSRHGIEFGGHTVSHPVLTQVSAEQAWEEIAGSRQRVQEETGEAVTAFAYPVGGEMQFNEAVKEVVRRAGYRFGVSYLPGANEWPVRDAYAVRRIRVTGTDSLDAFRAHLALPSVFR